MVLKEQEDNCLVIDLTKTMQRTPESQNKEENAQTYYVLQKFEPDEHTRIVRGNFHQGDERFQEFSRNKQCLAIAVVAICFFQINNNPATWKTADINLILINGDAQYQASYKKREKDLQTSNLLLSELYPYIKIGRNFYYLNLMDDESDSLRDERSVLKLSNLLTSLNRFFYENRNQYCVFTCNVFSFAIMRDSDSFFLFNSHATSYAGEPVNQYDADDSAACLMQVFTIKCLANHLMVACSQGKRVFDDSDSDPSIFYVMTSLIIEKKVFGKDISTRKKVTRRLCPAERKTCHLGADHEYRINEMKVKPQLKVRQIRTLRSVYIFNFISQLTNASIF